MKLDLRHRMGLATLTPRETEVLGLIGEGLSNTAIAGALGVEITSVETYMGHIREKLGIKATGRYSPRVLLALIALESGAEATARARPPCPPASRPQIVRRGFG